VFCEKQQTAKNWIITKNGISENFKKSWRELSLKFFISLFHYMLTHQGFRVVWGKFFGFFLFF